MPKGVRSAQVKAKESGDAFKTHKRLRIISGSAAGELIKILHNVFRCHTSSIHQTCPCLASAADTLDWVQTALKLGN